MHYSTFLVTVALIAAVQLCSADAVTSVKQAVAIPNLSFRLQPVTNRTFFVGVEANDEAFIIENSQFRFNAVKALSGNQSAVSFQSFDDTSKYLRHRGFVMWVEADDGTNSPLFRADASFFNRKGLIGNPTTFSYESVNFLDFYIQHQNLRLRISKKEDTNEFNETATWIAAHQ